MSQLNKDFQKQNVRFDISKLRQACDDVLKIKGCLLYTSDAADE